MIAALGSGTVLVGTFLPWVSSGSATRSSYDLFGVIDRLGFAPDGVVGWAVRLWPLVPLLLVTTAVSHALAPDPMWVRVARTAVTTFTAAYAGAVALAVRLAPDIGLIRPRIGPTVTAIGAIVLGASLTRARRPDRRGHPGAQPDDPS